MGEMKLISWNFAPKGWAFCNGQQLPINQNQALFSLLGTMYGGNGQTTFALPDLRGRAPIHVGAGFTQGQAGGQSSHTITNQEMPAHTHPVMGNSAAGTSRTAVNNVWASNTANPYNNSGNTTMVPGSVTNVGGSQPHENRQPYLVLNTIIALQGIFPSQN
jgi:microcystin-dependent protein